MLNLKLDHDKLEIIDHAVDISKPSPSYDLFKTCFLELCMSNNLKINWSDAIKREARGVNDYDLGEVQEISEDYIVTERGMVDKDKFILPKKLSSHFDGRILHLNLGEEDANKYKQ